MQNQEIFNQISKIDTSSIKDSSLKNALDLLFNLVENLQQEIIELKKTNQSLRDENNRGNYQSFKKHLKKVLHDYRDNSKIIIVVDNVRFHHAKLLKKWLIKHPKLELMYCPPI